MMLGGSKSKLAKHGENWEKVISGLFFSEGVGSTLSVLNHLLNKKILSRCLVSSPSDSLFFPAQKYNLACLINFCLSNLNSHARFFFYKHHYLLAFYLCLSLISQTA